MSSRLTAMAAVVAASVPVLAVLTLTAPARADSTWADHVRDAQRAHAAGDVAGFRDGMLRARAVLGETPGLSYQLARAAARLGDRDAALEGLRRYAASGLVRDATADSDFVALWGDSGFTALAARIRANGEPVEHATPVHTFRDTAMLPEDVVRDERRGRFLVSSIHRGRILEVGDRGRERVFAVSPHAARWAIFALGIDVRRDRLWASEVATPTCEGHSAADSGRSALLELALADGRLVRRLELPADGRTHVLGDLCVAADGTVWVTDSGTGALHRVRPGADSIETVLPPGTFASPQSPAPAPGGALWVADYPRGIARVDPAARTVEWLDFEPGVALQGIDGLYAVPGGLVAVQNGVNPRRVVRLVLDAAGRRVRGWEALESGSARLGEPTHGTPVTGGFVFLARTGWERVGPDERLRTASGVLPPALLRAALPVPARER